MSNQRVLLSLLAVVGLVFGAAAVEAEGDYDVVMRVLQAEMKTTFERVPKAVFAIKILNNPLTP